MSRIIREENSPKPHKQLPVSFISHWRVMYDTTSLPVEKSYNALAELVQIRKISECKFGKVILKEGGFLSKKRQYLRITYHGLIYDICVAPHGNSIYVSSWLGERPSGLVMKCLLLIPIINFWIIKKLETKTYYQYDNLMVFQEAVHTTVLKWIDELTTQHGLPQISNDQRKPIMKSMLKGFPQEDDIWGSKWDRAESN